jgi:hypothetical protein
VTSRRSIDSWENEIYAMLDEKDFHVPADLVLVQGHPGGLSTGAR